MSLSALHHALVAKDVDAVLAISRQRRVVPLRYAARIVCLLADRNDARYNIVARRFLVRVIEELEPPMEQVKKLADCLVSVHNSVYQHEARRGLQDVVVQLHQRERRLQVEFDGERGRR